MSAAPGLPFHAPNALSTRDAATLLAVSETTLRRALKRAREASPSATVVTGNFRDVPFLAWRETTLPRAPWRFAFDIDSTTLAPDEHHLAATHARAADERIRSLRSVIQERDDIRPIGTPEPVEADTPPRPTRRWWRFWR